MAKFSSLKKNEQIIEVIKKQNRVHSRDFSIYYLANQTQGLRLAISVAKKYFKKATQRNRNKRLIKAALIALDFSLNNFDLVIVLKPSFTDGDFLVLCHHLHKAIKKIISNQSTKQTKVLNHEVRKE
ncbi:hypothetical protein JM47_03790 [Ureaplasma diversum]|uniref:Ribonuclease P protein component n=2 Tax=Ureaplasma diversum TaxID=42094 RepID=A0A084EZQ1_9BACT|nr:ribonuclease P protein component [Ureaplasma diversum]AJQ45643.1 hypothetical protein JM47_03790 [Ureaplasma diversum]KEZ23443.1 Ribonuclease P protein component [Ureaplasma diversum NCTC 246]